MPPNILLIKPDDMGKEQFRLLGLGTAPYPRLPTIEKLQQQGVTFRRAYTYPQCSSTRALWATGCLGFRTGINTLIEGGSQPLLQGEVCLPAALDYAHGEGVYRKALFGKYHLSGTQTRGGEATAPIYIGYDYYDGQLRNLGGGEDYYSWNRTIAQRTRSGVVARTERCDTYAMTQLVDSALAWIARTPQPWLIDFCPNLPHGPYNRPPAGHYDAETWDLPDITPADMASLATKRTYFKACQEGLDYGLARLLNEMPQSVLAQTVIFLWPDNGTSPDSIDDAISGGDVKRSTKEFGVNTPLIVSGYGVSSPGRESQALVHAADLLATCVELSGGDMADVPLPTGHARDSTSFWPVCQSSTTTHRETIWLEIGTQGQNINCALPANRALVGERYKIGRGIPTSTGTSFPSSSGGAVDAQCTCYDLAFDPTEKQNLIGSQATTGTPPNNTVASPFVAAGVVTLTDVHPDHPGLKTAYDALVTAYAAQTTSL